MLTDNISCMALAVSVKLQGIPTSPTHDLVRLWRSKSRSQQAVKVTKASMLMLGHGSPSLAYS